MHLARFLAGWLLVLYVWLPVSVAVWLLDLEGWERERRRQRRRIR